MSLESLLGLVLYDLRARYPEAAGRQFPRRDLAAVNTVVLHHSATSCPQTLAETLALLGRIYEYHTGERGWPGLGYHYAIDGQGRVFWLNALELVTYHATSANSASVGVCWLGDWTLTAPSEAMVEAARRLYRGLEAELGRDLRLVGHKEVDGQTLCPGGHWAETRERLLGPAPGPAEPAVPAEWRAYGQTWPEVASNLRGVADDALETGRRLRDACRAAADLWGGR